jgi:hypothetical protein
MLSLVLPGQKTSDPCGGNNYDQPQQSPPYRIVSERLPHRDAFAVDRYAN